MIFYITGFKSSTIKQQVDMSTSEQDCSRSLHCVVKLCPPLYQKVLCQQRPSPFC